MAAAPGAGGAAAPGVIPRWTIEEIIGNIAKASQDLADIKNVPGTATGTLRQVIGLNPGAPIPVSIPTVAGGWGPFKEQLVRALGIRIPAGGIGDITTAEITAAINTRTSIRDIAAALGLPNLDAITTQAELQAAIDARQAEAVRDAEEAARAAAPAGGIGAAAAPNLADFTREVEAINALPALPPITVANIQEQVNAIGGIDAINAGNAMGIFGQIKTIIGEVFTRQQAIEERNTRIRAAVAAREALVTAFPVGAAGLPAVPGAVAEVDEDTRRLVAHMKQVVNNADRQRELTAGTDAEKIAAVSTILRAVRTPIPPGTLVPRTADLELNAAATQFGGRRARTARRRYRANQKTQRRRRVRFVSK